MFKVECLGCQAPYQVDEKRVPEKGLKMRCPKCGTSFKVEPPAEALPQSSSGTTSPDLPAQVAAPKKFASAAPARTWTKPANNRDALSRTMIGVSGNPLAAMKAAAAPKPATAAPVDAAPAVEREPASEERTQVALEATLALAEASKTVPEAPFDTGADLPAVLRARPSKPVDDEPELPAVISRARSAAPAKRSEAPAFEGLDLPALTSPREQKLAAPPAPEPAEDEDLPAVAARVPKPPPRRPRAPAPPPPRPSKKEPDLEASLPPAKGLELDLPSLPAPPPRKPAERSVAALDAELDLPSVIARSPSPAPSPPSEPALPAPRRALRDAPTRTDLPGVIERPAPAVALDDVDLPMAPRPAAPPRRVHDDLPDVLAPAAPAAPVAVAPTHSDLPEVFSTGLPVVSSAGLPAVSAGLPAVPGVGLPGVARPGLPAVPSAGSPALSGAGLPVPAAGLPSVSGAGLPAVSGAGLPAVSGAGLPAVSAGLPVVSAAGLPAVSSAGLPALAAGLPDVIAAGLPEVGGVGLPEVIAAGLPASSDMGLPEVTGRGVAGFGRVDLPEAREAGLPEVRSGAAGLVEVDLPGLGEALPALTNDAPFGDAGLPLVGGSLPMRKTRSGQLAMGDAEPFGPYAAPDEDPFAASEAEFGSALDGLGDLPEDPADGEFGARQLAGEAGDTPGYGEVDIGGDGAGGAALETAEDMEFSAIPQRDSEAPRARPAASASVRPDAGDVETAGSTLELGPERKPKNQRRRLAIAAAASLGLIAGGALALEPALGPFGIHFILDRVNRAEHVRLLEQLVQEGRRNTAVDTLAASEKTIASLESARASAPRFEPLAARAAYLEYRTALRFGPLPKLEAAGKAALDGIEVEADVQGLALARATAAAARRAPDAMKQLEALGSDVDARDVMGQLALALEDYKRAHPIWTELAKARPDDASVQYALGRAELGLGKVAEAIRCGRRALELTPGHVGANILLLEALRSTPSAAAATPGAPSVDELVAALSRDLPKSSPAEAALGHAVLGELHLAQGRSTPARQAFEEALAADRNFPRALVGLGETLHQAGRYSEALARFEAAAQAQPSSRLAQLGIAKSQLQLGHMPEAKTVLTRLRDANPGDPDVIYWIARAAQAAGETEAALEAYRAAIEAGKARTPSVEPYLGLAKLQSDLGQLALAEQTLSEATAKLPPSGALHNALGEIATTRAKYAEAYGHFQAALERDPGDTRARFLGAVVLTRLGRFEEALAAFKSVSEKDKDFPGLAIERGRLFEESGRNAEALQEFEAALAASPDDANVQVRVGCGRAIAGRLADAEQVLEKVLKARPRSAEAHYCLGRTLFAQERYIDAINRLERAVALDPTRAVYHLYLGWVANEVGRNAQAEKELENAIDLDKGLADAHWQRGRLRLKQGAVRDAVRDLETALELKPSRHEAVADLAMGYADLGRISKAISLWEDALARDPDNATWHFRYGKLLTSNGSPAQAAAHLKRAIDLAAESGAIVPGTPKEKPLWLWQAHYLVAREFGMVPAAIPHWQAYMRLSPPDDPYRAEAERALIALGQPWDGR